MRRAANFIIVVFSLLQAQTSGWLVGCLIGITVGVQVYNKDYPGAAEEVWGELLLRILL